MQSPTTNDAAVNPIPDATVFDNCVPKSCAELGANCGNADDGCGGVLTCGACPVGEICGTGEQRNTCAAPCVPIDAILFDLGETLVTRVGDTFETIPGVIAMNNKLKAKGIRTGIITNVPAGFTLEQLKTLLVDPTILDEFEVVLLSSLATAAKPAPVIYTEALGLFPAPAITRAAFVSEDIVDIASGQTSPTNGARAVGMLGILYSDTPNPWADYTVSTHAAIPDAQWVNCQ